MRRLQRGQAIVLIALMFGVLCGMVGLAIDGGRAYVDQRQIQNSADAAAVAGAATMIRKQSFTTAEIAVRDSYMLNRGLSSPSCSPAWTAPASGGSQSFSCTFGSDSSQGLTITVTDYLPPSSFDEFTATGSQSLLTALIQVASRQNTIPISASGCAATWDSGTCAAVPPVVLSTSTLCGSGGNALQITGDGPSATWPAVVGNIGSFGNVNATSKPGVAGDTTSECGSNPDVTSLCYPSAASLPCASYPTSSFHTGKPPLYNIPTASGAGTSQSWNGTAVNVSGGTYTGVGGGGGSGQVNIGGTIGPSTSPCVFLASGVYSYPAGLDDAGGVISNELRPPDEPDQSSSNHSGVKSPQFWNQNNTHCAGSFSVTAVADTTGGIALPTGAYAFRLSSVRTDNGVTRESGPSACRTLNVGLPGDGVSISVSNVPGAQDYNVYLSSTALSVAAADGDPSPGTCAGKFYYLASIPVNNYVNETSADTNGCPSTVTTTSCTLGVSAQVDDLCAIDRLEETLGIIGSVPVGCTTLLGSIPTIAPQPALTCSASAYVVVPPPANGLTNPPVAAACGWPGPITFRELLAPAGGSLPDQDPAVGYEIANWGACDDASTLKQLPFCPNNYNSTTNTLGYSPAAVLTPGAVQLQLGAGGCLSFDDPNNGSNHGLPFVFSGYQDSWGVVIHSGAPSCTDQLTPATGGEFVGHYYGTSTTATVAGTTPYTPYQGPQAPTVYGCFIAGLPTVDGSNGVAVYFVTPTQGIQITGYGIPIGSGC